MNKRILGIHVLFILVTLHRLVSAEWEFDQLFYKGTRSKKMHLKHLIFRSLCYFCNSLNFSPHDSIQKLRSAFPNSTLPDTTLYRYLAECKTVKDIDPCIVKHESTPDAIVLSKINETIMQDRFQSPREIASKVGASLNRTISKNTVKKYLHQYLHLESVSCTIIPHELTPEKRRIRVALSKIQSAILRELSCVDYLPLVTIDETWILYQYYPKRCFIAKGEDRPAFPKLASHNTKVMMTTMISMSGIHHWMLPKHQNITSELWNSETITQVENSWREVWSALPAHKKKAVTEAVNRAFSAAQQVIQEQQLPLLSLLPGKERLARAEQLCVNWKLLNKKKSTSTIGKEHTDELSSSSDEDSSPIITIPHLHPRRSAQRSSQMLNRLGCSWLSSSHKSDAEYTGSSADVGTVNYSGICPCFVHFDNAGPHNGIIARQRLSDSSVLIRMTQPPYSPDLAMCDFFYFGALKGAMPKLLKEADGKLDPAVTSFNSTLRIDILRSAMEDWQRRADWIASHDGDYYPSLKSQRKLTESPPVSSDLSLTNQSTPPSTPQTQLPIPSPVHILDTTQSTPPSPPRLVVPGIIGLRSTTNSCYAQALLQCIIATIPFVNVVCSRSVMLQQSESITANVYLYIHALIRQAWVPIPKLDSWEDTLIPVRNTMTHNTFLRIADTIPLLDIIDSYLSTPVIDSKQNHSASHNQQDVTDCYIRLLPNLVCPFIYVLCSYSTS